MNSALKTIQIILLLSTLTVAHAAQAAQNSALVKAKPANVKSLSAEQREHRLKHARELLGRYYSRSKVKAGEDIKKINGLIYKWTKAKLPKKFKRQHQEVAQTIIDESLKYGFDPVFLMSVIEGESSWRPVLTGGVGERGLMQIRPTTAEWISERMGIPYGGVDSLFDPVQNIKIGAAFLSYLRDHFDDHAQLYLAAYNMGQRNVATALKRDVWPKDYPTHVMKHYVEFYQTAREKMKAARKDEPLKVTDSTSDKAPKS